VGYKIFERIKLNINYPTVARSDHIRFLADISGRDSIASVVKIIEGYPESIVIPSIIELGCEYGDKSQYGEVYQSLKGILNGERVRIEQGIVCSGNELWEAIAGKEKQKGAEGFGFLSPCISCHLVLHIIRIKIARQLGIENVISGEKELHDGREKINQLSFVLDFYNMIYDAMGVVHHLPVRQISSTGSINDIIRKYGMKYVQLRCMFEGNYYKKGTNELAISKDAIREYVNKHLIETLDESGDMIYVPCSILR